MQKVILAAVAVAAALTATPRAQQPASPKPPRGEGVHPPAAPGVDVAAALKTAAPDLDARLARFKPVKMPYNSSALSARERQMVDQLVIALRQLENMFWRQSDPEGLALYKALEKVKPSPAQNT